MTRHLFLLLLLPAWLPGTALGGQTGDEAPSLELLEYLAEYSEDENGRLLDPMDQSDDDQTRSYSYREYMQERTDK